MLGLKGKGKGKEEDFYRKTQENANADRRDLKHPKKKKAKTEASPRWYYQIPAFLVTLVGALVLILVVQALAMSWYKAVEGSESVDLFTIHSFAPAYLFILPIALIGWWYANHQFRAVWMNNNAMYLSEDIEEYTNDSYVQTPVHMMRNFDPAPDAGLGFNGHVSSLVSHVMVENKGINKIAMPQLDPDAPGQVKKDKDGNVVTKKMPMFDKQFGVELFGFSNVPSDHQKWYDATEYDFNPKTSRKEQRAGIKRQGSFGQKEHDKLADYINNEFYPIDTDTQRPAGVYFYDARPVNTILIAITRGGKGQTYIEPIMDLWTREKEKWNMFATDPKGGAPRSIVKSNGLAA